MTQLGMRGRQHGGDVTRGQPFVVGEKRPELFVPSQNGRIIPRVPSGGGAATVVVNFYSTVPPDRNEAEQVLLPLIERGVNKMIEQSRQ